MVSERGSRWSIEHCQILGSIVGDPRGAKLPLHYNEAVLHMSVRRRGIIGQSKASARVLRSNWDAAARRIAAAWRKWGICSGVPRVD